MDKIPEQENSTPLFHRRNRENGNGARFIRKGRRGTPFARMGRDRGIENFLEDRYPLSSSHLHYRTTPLA